MINLSQWLPPHTTSPPSPASPAPDQICRRIWTGGWRRYRSSPGCAALLRWRKSLTPSEQLNHAAKDHRTITQAPGEAPWTNNFFSCFSPADTCFVTCCCPCVTFGKTHHRLQNNGDLSTYSPLNFSVSALLAPRMVPLRSYADENVTVPGLVPFDLLLPARGGQHHAAPRHPPARRAQAPRQLRHRPAQGLVLQLLRPDPGKTLLAALDRAAWTLADSPYSKTRRLRPSSPASPLLCTSLP